MPHVHLPVHHPFLSPAYLSTYLPAACLSTDLPAAYLSTCLLAAYLSTNLPAAYMLTYLPPTFSYAFADSMALGMHSAEAFGQSEALTTRLRHIIQDYPEGAGILMELLQNADDAGTFFTLPRFPSALLHVTFYREGVFFHDGLQHLYCPPMQVLPSYVGQAATLMVDKLQKLQMALKF